MEQVILGVDPGFVVTGFGILKREGRRTTLMDYGVLRLSSTKTLSWRVGQFYDFFSQKITEHGVNVIALETPFLGKNAQNFLKLGYLRGILYLLARNVQAELKEFSPTQVKQSVTGFGGAGKDQVARAVMLLLPGLKKPDLLDVTDAIAVTLCGLWALPQIIHKETTIST